VARTAKVHLLFNNTRILQCDENESQSAFKGQRVTMEPDDLLGSLPVFVHLTLRPALHTGVQSGDLDVFSLITTIQYPVPTGF
jgi:hypothetical protein